MAVNLATNKLTQPRVAEQTLAYEGFPLGLNKSVGDKQLQLGELTEALNIMYNDDGKIITRPGIEKHTITGTDSDASIMAIGHGLVDVTGTRYDTTPYDTVTYGGGDASALKEHIVVADENHKVYYLENQNLLPIATNYTAEGDVSFCSFGGYVMISDGEYLKYWDGTSFKIAYDFGTGTSGYQFDDTDLSDDTSDSLYTGAHTRFGGSFTTQHWTSGFTIPILSVDVVLSKTGSPTGSLVAKLYDSTRTTTHATSEALNVADLTTASVKNTLTFDASSTYSMAPDTTYFLSFEYTGGDAGNHVDVHLDTVASAGTAYYYSGSSWTAVATQQPLMAVQPGRPPKSSYAIAWQDRLWMLDPDNPGWARFSNANSIFDWSTTDGGGYIGSINDSAMSFPIGTIIPHYGVLYIIGRHDTPYVSRVSGVEPTDFVQTILLQALYGAPKTVVSTINDIWIENDIGIYAISGVQEFGDIRSSTPGNPIQELVRTYHDANAKVVFNPIHGQVWVKLSGYNRVLVGHTRRAVKMGNAIRYPWTEYEFKGIFPRSFGFSVDKFYIGASDGHLYTLTAEVLDQTTQPDYDIKSCINENPFGQIQVREYFLSMNSDAAATMSMKFYKNGSASPIVTKAISGYLDRILGRLNFSCRSLQFELDTFVITKPVNIGEVYLKALPLKIASSSAATVAPASAGDGTMYSVTMAIDASYSISDNGVAYRYIYFLTSGSTNQTIVPTGTYRTGIEVVIYNTGNAVLTFDPTGINVDILPGDAFSPTTFSYDGTQWR